MDEIHDAIQDAQYIGAMADPVPRPTASFNFPTPEQLDSFRQKKSGTYSSLSNILTHPLGFYMFKRFCQKNGAKIQMEFMEEVIYYRKTTSALRPQVARDIWLFYFQSDNLSARSSSSTRKLKSGVCRNLSDITVIAPIDRYMEYFSDKTLLGIDGSIVNDINICLRLYQDSIDIRSSSLPESLFDELELAIYYKLSQTHFTKFLRSTEFDKFLSFLFIREQPVGEHEFGIFRVLGRGGFGMVNASIKKTTGKLFAMKMMNKKIIKSKNAEELCLNERNVLAKIDSPFVVCLRYAYQTTDDLILILDLMTGGDFGYHLSKERFTEEKAVFYAAQIFLGLSHLHENNVVFRDLKPENVLLDDIGNSKLSDLGLAVEISNQLTGRCGTRGYWAPEMLERSNDGSRIPYNHAVDYWSFGCLVYELIYGKCPFRTTKAKSFHMDRQKSMDIATLEMKVEFDPKLFSPAAQSLISGLLIRNPTRRLGVNDPNEVKNHPFFSTIDWVMLQNGKLTPPFVPKKHINAASQSVIGSFDMESVKKVKITKELNDIYSSWYFLNPISYEEEIIEFLEWEDKQSRQVFTSIVDEN